jgi:hypothetical protein
MQQPTPHGRRWLRFFKSVRDLELGSYRKSGVDLEIP